jgi:predicted nucleic acid-binding protein
LISDQPSVRVNSAVHSYEISAEKNHDVYDSFMLALARTYDADSLITTDDDFEELCDGEAVTYTNPIPPDKRSKLPFIQG